MRLALPLGRARASASLGGKLVLILTGVGLAGALAIALLLAGIIMPSFGQLETRSTDAHVERTRAALGEYVSKVESAVRDYGDWNDSYEYMAAPSAAFERESFSKLAMVNLDVNGMAYVGNDGRIVIARWLDTDHPERDLAMRARLIAMIRGTDLAGALKGGNSTGFYTRLGGEVAAVGVAQVRRSDGTGTPRGWVLMVRAITPAQLSTLLQIDARIDLDRREGAAAIARRWSTLDIAVPIAGADGRAVAAATFTIPRDVSMLGRRMLLLAVAGSTMLLLVLLVVLRRVIGRLVLKPLGRVESHMQTVRASGSLGLLADDGRQDEIGSLGRSFNSMLSQLKDLREQVELQSFALGRSESAVAVMHNVRNALNPITTILSLGIADRSTVDRAMTDRALAELARDDLPPVRRQKLAAFVLAAIEAEEKAREDRRQQLLTGRSAMQTVLEIIGQQQAQAHERPALESCDVTELVAQNAAIARYSGGNRIAFSFPEHPVRVMASRLILSQVIGNLFGNAAEAIAARGTGTGSIAVTVADADGRVEIVIQDDGEGFSPEIGAQLFQRGYSTREHKSGGLGLHWCANSMTAMGGALRLESDGPGRGARAVLTLQAAEAEGQALAA